MAEEVSSIGVKLTLNASSFMTGMTAATAKTEAFVAATKQAATVAGGAAGGGKTTSRASAAPNIGGVAVDLTVSAASIKRIRQEIIQGIGSIPITITPQMSKAVSAEAQKVVAAQITPVVGTRTGAAHTVATNVRQNLPKREHGGPVHPGQDYIVGERRPEVFRPRVSGTIHPDADRYYREEQRRHMGGYARGGNVRSAPSVPPKACPSCGLVNWQDMKSGAPRSACYGCGASMTAAPRRAAAGIRVEDRLTTRQRQYTRNIRDAARRMTNPDDPYGAAALKMGTEWYPEAQRWIAKQAAAYNMPEPQVRGIVASLSAGTAWSSNKTKALRIFDAHAAGKPFPYQLTLDAHKKAKRILEGADPWDVLGHTPKVGQFFQNTGGDLDAITIDRWALRTGTRGAISQAGRGPVRTGVEKGFRKVAAEMGMHPVQLQAALWIQEKAETDAAMGRTPNLAKYMAKGGRVKPFCSTCRCNIRDPFTHQSTAKHIANLRGGSRGSGDWLKEQPSWAYGLRNMDSQYDPEGYEADTSWWGKKAAGGATWMKGVGPVGSPDSPIPAFTRRKRHPAAVRGDMEYAHIPKGKANLKAAVAAIEAHNLAMGEAGAPSVVDEFPIVKGRMTGVTKDNWKEALGGDYDSAAELERITTNIRAGKAGSGGVPYWPPTKAEEEGLVPRVTLNDPTGTRRMRARARLDRMKARHGEVPAATPEVAATKPNARAAAKEAKARADIDKMLDVVEEKGGWSYPQEQINKLTTEERAKLVDEIIAAQEAGRYHILYRPTPDKIGNYLSNNPHVARGEQQQRRESAVNARLERMRAGRTPEDLYGGLEGVIAAQAMKKADGPATYSAYRNGEPVLVVINQPKPFADSEEVPFGANGKTGYLIAGPSQISSHFIGLGAKGQKLKADLDTKWRVQSQLRHFASLQAANPTDPYYAKATELLAAGGQPDDAFRDILLGGSRPETTAARVPQHEAPEVIAHKAVVAHHEEVKAQVEKEVIKDLGLGQHGPAFVPPPPPDTSGRIIGPSLFDMPAAGGPAISRQEAFERLRGLGLKTVKRGRRSHGGYAAEGQYIVNELGPEAFIEQRDVSRLAANRPDIMARIPGASDGAKTGMIQKPAWSMFAPRKNGLIVRREDAAAALAATRAQRGADVGDEDIGGYGGPLLRPGQSPYFGPPAPIISAMRAGGGPRSEEQMKAAKDIREAVDDLLKPMVRLAEVQEDEVKLLANPQGFQLRGSARTSPPVSDEVITAGRGMAAADRSVRERIGGVSMRFPRGGGDTEGLEAALAAARDRREINAIPGVTAGQEALSAARRRREDAAAEANRHGPAYVPPAAAPPGATRAGPAPEPEDERGQFGQYRTFAEALRRQYPDLGDADIAQALRNQGIDVPAHAAAGRHEGEDVAIAKQLHGESRDFVARNKNIEIDPVLAASRARLAGQAGLESSGTPRRVFSSIAQLTGGGGIGFRQRQEEYRQAQQNYNRSTRMVDTWTDAVDGAQYSVDNWTGSAEGLEKEQTRLSNAQGVLAVRTAKHAEYADKLAVAEDRAAVKSSGVIKSFGSQVLAFTAYGAAFGAVTTVINQAAIPAIKKVADEMLGWTPTMTAVTTALSDQTAASHGNVDATLAQAGATAALSGTALDWVQGLLESTVVAKAGAKAQGETMELMRAAYGAQGQSVPQGLFGGYGGLLGSSLLGAEMGGGKGFSENIQGQFAGNRNRGPNLLSDLSRGVEFAGNVDVRNTVLGAAKEQGNPLGGIGDLLGGYGDLVRTLPTPLQAFAPGGVGAMIMGKTPSVYEGEGGYNAQRGLDQGQLEANTAGFNDLNEAAKRAGKATDSAATITYGYAASKDEEDAAVKRAAASGDVFGATMARTSHIVMRVNGEVAKTNEAYQEGLQQTAKGKTMVPEEVFTKDLVRQLTAGREVRGIQTQQQMKLDLPYDLFKNLLANPLIAPGAAFGGRSAREMGASGAAAGMTGGAMRSTIASQSNLAAMAQQGLAEARSMIQANGTGTDLPDFNAAAEGASAASADIARLTTNMMKLNAEASRASWGNQIRLASRALHDALGMMGKVGGTRLGQLQREQWLISRASQQLSLQLQQRQITTQIALAGFQAPGETGEERYMRQKEKLAEADIAQRQLNFSFKEFTVSGSIWKENLQRAVTDARASLGVMQAARNAELYTIQAQQAVAARQQELAQHVGRMDAILNKARGNFGDNLSAAGGKVAEFGGSVATATTEIMQAMGYHKTKSGWRGGGLPNGNMNLVPPDAGGANGLLGMTMGETNFVAGEVKGEAVAILKNPHMGSFAPDGGGGGGTNQVFVNINGPVVRGEQDIAMLARSVADEVERRLSRKGQMLGLRSPSY